MMQFSLGLMVGTLIGSVLSMTYAAIFFLDYVMPKYLNVKVEELFKKELKKREPK